MRAQKQSQNRMSSYVGAVPIFISTGCLTIIFFTMYICIVPKPSNQSIKQITYPVSGQIDNFHWLVSGDCFQWQWRVMTNSKRKADIWITLNTIAVILNILQTCWIKFQERLDKSRIWTVRLMNNEETNQQEQYGENMKWLSTFILIDQISCISCDDQNIMSLVCTI